MKYESEEDANLIFDDVIATHRDEILQMSASSNMCPMPRASSMSTISSELSSSSYEDTSDEDFFTLTKTHASSDRVRRQLVKVESADGLVTVEDAKFSQSRARTLILEYIIMNQHPFTEVESDSFIRLMMYQRAEFKPFCAKALQKGIELMYHVHQQYVHQMLKVERDSGTLFHLGIDLWSPKHLPYKSYLACTIQYVTADFQTVRFVLGFAELSDAYSGEDIKAELVHIGKKYDILPAIISIAVGDRISNTDAMRLIKDDPELCSQLAFGGEFLHDDRCLLSMFHAFAIDALFVYMEEIRNLRFLVKHIHSNDQHYRSFIQAIEVKAPTLLDKVKQSLDDEGRWWLKEGILSKCLNFKDALVYYQKTNPSAEMREVDFACIQLLQDFIRPFAEIRDTLSTAESTHMHLAYDCLLTLSHHINKAAFRPMMNGVFYNSQSRECTSMLLKYSKNFEKSQFPAAFKICHILNPRWRLHFIKSVHPSEYDDCLNLITRVFREHYYHYKVDADDTFSQEVGDGVTMETSSTNTVASDITGPISAEEFARRLEAALNKKRKRETTGMNELWTYLNESGGGDDFKDVLQWWNSDVPRRRFPRLRLMARHFFGMECARLYCDTTFEHANKLIGPNRATLSADTLQMLMECDSFLTAGYKYNWHLNHNLFPELDED